MATRAPLLIGHRGAQRTIPENTIVSFDLALEHGCDGIEFDLRLTACGRALVAHSPKVGGVTVARATARQLLHFPRLDDILRHYGHHAFLGIELKARGLESQVLAALRERSRTANYVVSSFFPDVVMDLRARSALVPVGIICRKASQLVEWRKLPADYVMVHHELLTQKLVRIVQATGRKIFAWTVNDKRSMLQFAAWGVDGIISDNTELLTKTFA